MAVEKKIYQVTEGNILSSNKHLKYFFPGETVDLSHARADEIEALIKAGAIVEVKKEVK